MSSLPRRSSVLKLENQKHWGCKVVWGYPADPSLFGFAALYVLASTDVDVYVSEHVKSTLGLYWHSNHLFYCDELPVESSSERDDKDSLYAFNSPHTLIDFIGAVIGKSGVEQQRQQRVLSRSAVLEPIPGVVPIFRPFGRNSAGKGGTNILFSRCWVFKLKRAWSYEMYSTVVSSGHHHGEGARADHSL